MTEAGPCLRTVKRLFGAAILVLAAPTWAGSWTFASDEPLLLGGSVSGSFTGVDSNADAMLTANELNAFSASYIGAPPATSSFTISKPVLDATDSFSFDLTAATFGFEVFGGNGLVVSGGSFAFTSVVGADFVDAGGMLQLTPVPEPAPVVLMPGGLAFVARALRQHRAASSFGAEQAA